MAEESKINLWVRSEQHLYSDETLELIPSERIDEYVIIVDEIAICEAALNEALGKRYRFFEEVSNGKN